ncbi:uncharacterized protein NPIL_82511 [Nephila pilipes]|uniref:Uncharacterized protein n=1 Tax=Nephila pilipes TaxID=299642 RepID=A0A8X6UVC9_NEPPI|nr:uncharacterized protein NPIL_82511 [Nephila pilipes]
MNYTNNFKTDKRLGTLIRIFTNEEKPQMSRNSYHPTFKLPVLLVKSMSCIGLLVEANENIWQKIISITFRFLLIFINLSLWISSLMLNNLQEWKVMSAYLASSSSILVMYFAMYCERNALTITLQKLSKISVSNNEMALNGITIILFSFPVIYSVLQSAVYDDDEWLSRFETYGYDIENHTVKVLVLSFKTFLYGIVHPTFTCLVALLYCVLCQRYRTLIKNLTQKVKEVSPKDFGPSKQIDILRRKSKIDDIFQNIQYIFSVPSFFMTAVNFLMCGSMIGWLLSSDTGKLQPNAIVEIAFYIVIDFSSLFVVLWIAGGMPIELKKLKYEFNRKIRLRLLHAEYHEETEPKSDLFGQSDFSFSGCDIISFKRSMILAFTGTLITYTFLVISI